MRLSPEQRQAIVSATRKMLGGQARVWLFGSRTDDTRNGGDIDLLIDLPDTPENSVMQAARLAAAFQFALGDQKIDVVLSHPHNQNAAIVVEAKRTGVPL